MLFAAYPAGVVIVLADSLLSHVLHAADVIAHTAHHGALVRSNRDVF